MRARTLLIVAAALAASAGGCWLWAQQELRRGAGNEAPVQVVIPPGASLRSALRLIASAGALRHPRLLEWQARLEHAGVPPKVGRYLIEAHATPLQLLEQLLQGRVILEQLTVVEGWTFAQMRHALDTDPNVAHDWARLGDQVVMGRLGQAGTPAEGRFFPDSYRFAAGTSDSEIYRMAFERMQRELATAWQDRDRSLPLGSATELLIFASIVERETGREDERAKVAAVFANRLRQGMRLQSDPTIIYGLGARYDGDIRKRDIATDSRYNTYTRDGLTPTPIALPGAAALQAAAHPAAIRALYFVAAASGDGTHVFSETLAQHNAAVKRLVARTRRKAS
jgi:UPF0755 protein